MMEQLQRLAEVIAETYIRDLRRETGSNVLTVDGVSGCIEAPLLSAGLVDNAVSASKDKYDSTFERKAYRMLMEFISFDGPEYRLTEHGRHVITVMNTISLKKNKVRIMH